MKKMKEEYDFSDYPKDHPLYDETNKKVIGKFKDECAGVAIAEYVGLRPTKKDGIWKIYFRHQHIKTLDLKNNCLIVRPKWGKTVNDVSERL